MEPISTTAAIIMASGSVLQGLIGAIGSGLDDSDERIAKADRDAHLKIAADKLGLDYKTLQQQAEQFYQSQKTELKKWADQKGLSLRQLSETERSNKAGEALQAGQLKLGQESLKSGKEQFAIQQASNPNVVREKRLNDLRKAFLTPKVPKAITPPKPTSKTVVPTATPSKNLGAEALSTPSTTQQGVV